MGNDTTNSTTNKKSLSLRQAQNCENAKEPVCKCRCGGALHGAKRGGDNPSLSFFETLPQDDPHRLLSKAEKRERINAAKREETRLKHERWMAYINKQYAPKKDDMPQGDERHRCDKCGTVIQNVFGDTVRNEPGLCEECQWEREASK